MSHWRTIKMTKVSRVPTDREWTAETLIKALQGVSPETKLIFGSSTKTTADATGTCWCGCGLPTAKKFAPGHDARFHGLAKKVARGQAHRPTSFVSPEAEADFDYWIERTRREHAMQGLLKNHTLSWEVSAFTLVPTGYLPEQIDPRLFEAIAAKGVISDPVKLRACLSDPEA
jgi:hypothetical protein